jgi:hypothetical protein
MEASLLVFPADLEESRVVSALVSRIKIRPAISRSALSLKPRRDPAPAVSSRTSGASGHRCRHSSASHSSGLGLFVLGMRSQQLGMRLKQIEVFCSQGRGSGFDGGRSCEDGGGCRSSGEARKYLATTQSRFHGNCDCVRFDFSHFRFLHEGFRLVRIGQGLVSLSDPLRFRCLLFCCLISGNDLLLGHHGVFRVRPIERGEQLLQRLFAKEHVASAAGRDQDFGAFCVGEHLDAFPTLAARAR